MLPYDSKFDRRHKHAFDFETTNTLVQEYSVLISTDNLKVRHCTVLDRELVTLSIKC